MSKYDINGDEIAKFCNSNSSKLKKTARFPLPLFQIPEIAQLPPFFEVVKSQNFFPFFFEKNVKFI